MADAASRLKSFYRSRGSVGSSSDSSDLDLREVDRFFGELADFCWGRDAGEQASIKWVADFIPLCSGVRDVSELEKHAERMRDTAPSPRAVWLLRRSLLDESEFYRLQYPKMIERSQGVTVEEALEARFRSDRPLEDLLSDLLAKEKGCFGPFGDPPPLPIEELYERS